MIEIILSALLLTLIQSWLIPMLLNLGNLSFLLSNRDEDFEFSTITKRAQRASANLYETLPVFITLMLLGVILDIDLTLSGSLWIALRVLFLMCYLAGIKIVRSGIWVASVVTLIMMGLNLVAIA
ncbi:MAG: MAPEG family protein [Pseudomonadota bacterium]|nr:MAPEG family protein [Pseudomonadota bacterium]